MLTQEQITQLSHKIRQETETRNPMVALIKAAKGAELPFKDVLEYVLSRALQDIRNDSGNPVNGSPSIVS